MLCLVYCSTAWGNDTFLKMEPVENKKILSIYTLSGSSEIRRKLYDGLIEILDKQEHPYIHDILNLNLYQHHDPTKLQTMLVPHLPAIRAGQYDVIIVYSDRAAADFIPVLKEIPDSTAVIFSNITQFDPEWRIQHRNITGIIRQLKPESNIELGMQLFPDTEEIILLTSSYAWNDKDTKVLAKSVPPSLKLTVCYLENNQEALEKIKTELKYASKKSFLVGFGWDLQYQTETSRKDIQNWIAENYKGPCFYRRFALVENGGGIGGVIMRYQNVGRITGEYTSKIFAGTRADQVPIQECPEEIIVNKEQIRRFHVKNSRIPPNATYVHIPNNFDFNYMKSIQIVCVVLGVLLLVVSIFLVYLQLDQRRLKRLVQMLKCLPMRFIVLAEDGEILFFQRENSYKTSSDVNYYKYQKDIPWFANTDLKERLYYVFSTGKMETMDYDFYGQMRTAYLIRLNEKLFGRPAVVIVSIDISRFQTITTEMQFQVNRLNVILQTIESGIIIVDQNENITFFNSCAEKLTGLTESEIIGNKISGILNMVNLTMDKSTVSLLRQVMATGETIKVPIRGKLTNKNGISLYLSEQITPIILENGSSNGAILIFHDITNDFEELEKANEINKQVQLLCSKLKYSFFRYIVNTGESVTFISSVQYRPIDNAGKQVPLRQWLTPESYDETMQQIDSFVKGKNDIVDFQINTCYNGITHCYHVYGVSPKKNTFNEFTGIFIDITDEEKKRNLERETSDLQSILLKYLPVSFYVKDVNHYFSYLYVNKTFQKECGRNINDIVGHNDFELFNYNLNQCQKIRDNDLAVVNSSDGYMELYEQGAAWSKINRNYRSFKRYISLPSGRRLLLGVSLEVSDHPDSSCTISEKQALFAAILDAIPFSIFVKDISDGGLYRYWNISAEKKFGIAFLQGKLTPDTISKDKEFLSQLDYYDQEAVQTPVSIECDLKNPNSKDRNNEFFHIIKIATVAPDGHSLVITIANELASNSNALWKKNEPVINLSFYSDIISHCLTELLKTDDYKTLVNSILEIIGKHFAADRCYIFDVDQSSFVRKFEFNRENILPLEKKYPFTQMTEWLKAFNKNHPIVIANRSEISSDLIQYNLDPGVLSTVALPIIYNEYLYGFFGVDYVTSPHATTEQEIQLFQMIIHIYLMLTDRELKQTHLSRTNDMYSQIFDNIEMPAVIIGADRNVIAVNQCACTVFNRTRSQLMKHNCDNRENCLCAAESNHGICLMLECPVRYALESGQTGSLDRIIGKRQMRYRAQPIFDDRGKVRFVIETIADITNININNFGITNVKTQQKENEGIHKNRLENANENNANENNANENNINENQVIVQCLEALLTPGDLQEACQKIVEIIGKNLQADNAGVFEYRDNDPPCFFRNVSWSSNVSRHDLTNVDIIPEKHNIHLNKHLKSGLPADYNIANPILHNDDLWVVELRRYLLWAKQQEIILFPLFIDGHFWGHFSIEHSQSDYHFGESGMRLLRIGAEMLEYLFKSNNEHQYIKKLEQERMYLINMPSAPILITDRMGLVLHVNSAFSLLRRTVEKDITGKNISLIYPEIMERFTSAVKNKKVEHELHRIDNTIYEVLVNPLPEGYMEDRIIISFLKQYNLNESDRSRPEVKIVSFSKIPIDETLGSNRETVIITSIKDPETSNSVSSPTGKAETSLALSANRDQAEKTLPEEKRKEKRTIPNILVLDDLSMNIKILSAMFKYLKIPVITFTKGSDALKALENSPCDIIMTDLWMPEMDGVQFAQEVREKFPHIKMYAVTADIDCHKNFNLSLFIDVLIKPVTLVKIKKILSQWEYDYE